MRLIFSPLEGIDEDGTPGCEALKPFPEPCGAPSSYRLYGRCLDCENNGYFFTCQSCYGEMMTTIGGCGMCGGFNLEVKES